nr:armadillo repeat-containing X-linked protein 4 isoform X39 [Drosophila simulans]
MMEVPCKILAVCLLLVGAQAFAAAEATSSSKELTWQSLFYDAVTGKLQEPLAEELIEFEECTALYTVENIEILLKAGYKIRRCGKVESKDIERYLERQDAFYTKRTFERELVTCALRESHHDNRQCYVDTVLNLFSSVRPYRYDRRRYSACIFREVEKAVIKLNAASIALANCIAQSQPQPLPPQNSTLPPPPQNSTTEGPWWGNTTTQGPWWGNTTTQGPWWGNTTTQGPWWGNTTTEGPWWGNTTTQGPWWGNTTTQGPWWGNTTTQGPWWGNTTTQGPWWGNNSTEGPWWGNNSTEGPWWGNNSTQGPWWGNNSTEGPWWGNNSTQGPWWGNNSTQGPWWGNNSTEGPWWTNTTQTPPIWNSTTLGPNFNSTEGPWIGNSTQGPVNTTTTPWWNNTTASWSTTTDRSTTEGNWFDHLMNEIGNLF